MNKKGTQKSFFSRLRNKYRLAVFNEQTYEEVWGVRLSRLNAFTVIGSVAVIIVILIILLIAYTGLREYIPGYPDAHQRHLIVRNANRVDSLVQEIDKRDKFFNSIKSVVEGKAPEDYAEGEDSKQQTSPLSQELPNLNNTERDEEFRQQIEAEEKFNLAVLENKSINPKLNQVYFFPPIKGIVVNKFDESEHHLGIDIVAKPEATVAAILDGTVIFSGWTVETGYVIILQHSSDIISVYKHNSRLLKDMGDIVKAGEAIANTGNSGELTSGPHLHFELWYQAKALNPEEYILFE